MNVIPLRENSDAAFIRFPRDTMRRAFFALERGSEGRRIRLTENEKVVEYVIGGDQGEGFRVGALTVDDAAVLMGLLALHEGKEARVNFGSLTKLGVFIWGGSFGGKKLESLVYSLGCLRTTGIVRLVSGNPRGDIFSIIEGGDVAHWQEAGQWENWPTSRVTYKSPNAKFVGSWVSFSPQFLTWLADSLDVDPYSFLNLRTRLARGLFLYLPSLAFRPGIPFSSENPRSVTLTEVLMDLGVKVPGSKAQRLQLFERPDRKGRVLEQLDGARLWCGKFRCRKGELFDGSDYTIELWIDRDPLAQRVEQVELPLGRQVSASKREGNSFKDSFLAGGGMEEEWKEIVGRSVAAVDIDHELRELCEARVFSKQDALRNQNAVRLAFKALGPHGMYDVRNRVANALTESVVGGPSVRAPGGFWTSLVRSALFDLGALSKKRRMQLEAALEQSDDSPTPFFEEI